MEEKVDQWPSKTILMLNILTWVLKAKLHEYIGHEQIITFSYLGQELLGKFTSSIDVEIEKEMTLFIDLNNISIFDKDTKQRI